MQLRIEKSRGTRSRAVAASTRENPVSRAPASPPLQRKTQVSSDLTGSYKRALIALTQNHQGKGDATSDPATQLVLEGNYAKAAVKIGSYMGKSAARSAEQLLQRAQDLGFRAPNLPGHMSSSSGKDGKGEKERQKQINAAWTTWKNDFEAWLRNRNRDDDDDGAAGGAVVGGNRRTESNREERKAQRGAEKRRNYEQSQEYKYVPPWKGGPSAW